MEILNSCTDCDEIQFMEDGSWCPMRPRKESQELCQPPAFSGIEGTAAEPFLATSFLPFGDPGSSLGCAKNAAGSRPRRRGCRWPPPSDPHPFASAAPSVYTVSPEGKTPPEGRRKVEVIDLTLDSSSDEEEPPAKKQRPASGGALPAAPGPKG